MKNSVSNLAEVSVSHSASIVLLDESPLHIPTVKTDEIQHMAQFLPVLLLIHKSSLKNLPVPRKITTSKSLPKALTSNKLLEFFNKEVQSTEKSDTDGLFEFGEVTVNFSSMEVSRKGQTVTLTALEFKILKHFLLNPRRVLSREELLKEVWGYKCYPSTRTVDNHVLKLRQKLEPESEKPVHFRTIHGSGYKFLP